MQTYNVIEAAPSSIVETNQKGTDGLIPETPKKGNRNFERVKNVIVGSNRIALAAAKKKEWNKAVIKIIRDNID